MSHAAADPSVTIPKAEGTPLAARHAPDNDNTQVPEPHTAFAKLDAVIQRERRLRLMTAYATSLLLVSVAVAAAALLLGCSAGEDPQEQANLRAVETTVAALNGNDPQAAAAVLSMPLAATEFAALRADLDEIPGAQFELVDWVCDGDTMQSTLIRIDPADARAEQHPAAVIDVEELYGPGGARSGLPNPDVSYTPREYERIKQYELIIRLYTIHDHDGRVVSWTTRSELAVRGASQ